MYSDQVKEMHRQNVRQANAALLAAGVCVMHVPHGEDPPRAAYMWHSRKIWGVGNELPLCEECCAFYRASATAGDIDAPEAITLLAQ